jgi:cellulose synthase/poly-beta-1,6-N-acetylglucosamine synthase-like glycosyltransferase
VSEPVVSVLIPVLNEQEHIRDTIDLMLGQEGVEGEIEFLFVDGRSTDDTRAILEEAAAREPRIRVLDNPRRQTAAALNIALHAARAPVVARMDAHTFYPRDYLARGLERLAKGDVVWVSGAQLPRPVDGGTRRVALALETRLGTGGASFRKAREEELEANTGFTGVFDRAFLEKVGGWDEDWPINQDAELGARVGEAGGRMVIIPAMAAGYVPRRTLDRLARQYFRYGMYRAKTSRRHPHSMRFGHLLPPSFLLALVLAAIFAATGIAKLHLAALVIVLVYVAALLGAMVSSARRAGWRDAIGVPPVLVVMHQSWGAGFLTGCVRWGPPFRGAAHAIAQQVRSLTQGSMTRR